jgi:hypothetical protein
LKTIRERIKERNESYVDRIDTVLCYQFVKKGLALASRIHEFIHPMALQHKSGLGLLL